MASEDSKIATEKARLALPLRRLMEQNGDGPRDSGDWKNFACPFCGNKSAGLFSKNGPEVFKCHYTGGKRGGPCPSGNVVMDEAGYLAAKSNINRNEAWQIWLKQAGVWKEGERLAPSVMPGQRSRKAKILNEKPPEGLASDVPKQLLSDTDEDEELIQQCIEVIRSEQRASVSLLQRRLRLGYTRAAMIMDELEKRGIVGPAKGAEPRDILIDLETLPGNEDGTNDLTATSAPANQSVNTDESSLCPTPVQDGLTPSGASKPQDEAGAAGRAIPADQVRAQDEVPSSEFKVPGGIEDADTGTPIESTAGGPGAEDAGAAKPSLSESEEDDSGQRDVVVEFPGGGGGGGGDDEGPSVRALRAFYDRLVLTPDDEALLLQKRGLTAATLRALGHRSNLASNRDILLTLNQAYTHAMLREAGLWKGEGAECKPNTQFSGFGMIGKKPKRAVSGIDDEAELDESDLLWGWTHPPLIAYWDERGELTHLRPHKGMSKGGTPRLYVSRDFAALRAKSAGARPDVRTEQYETVVICEGEFKADAVWQTLHKQGIGACAIPGVTMAKHAGMQDELLQFLRRCGAKRVVVAFDNEEKGDPKLESYKEDPWRRYDTQVWARYLAGWLKGHWFDGQVAWLPDAWRDEKGKADWDGVLARMFAGTIPLVWPDLTQRREDAKTQRGTELSTDGTDATDGKTETVESLFLRVIEAGKEPDDVEQLALLDGQAERIIKNKLVRLRHTPLLAYGGDKEMKIARALWRLAKNENYKSLHARANWLAGKFKAIIGWYYERKPAKMTGKAREELEAAQERASYTKEWDLQTFLREVFNGVPEPVADFKLDCKFTLVKANGTRERMVILSNRLGKTKLIALDADSFTAPRDFKRWVENQGPFTWMTGEGPLEQLRHDVHQQSAHLEVYEISHFGWHEESKLWFFNDCVVTPLGTTIKPDNFGIVWWNGLGYMLSRTDSEGENFAHKRPRMEPDLGIRFPNAEDVKASASKKVNKADEDVMFRMEPGEDDPAALQALFQELSFAMRETLDSPECYLLLGAMLAFGVAPEFLDREKWFSGAWVHGERGSGKSTIVGFLMRIWGFQDLESGTKLPDSTKVGMQIAAMQYSNLPIWFEEYTKNLDPYKVEFIKSLYNRELAMKKEFRDQRRVIRTNAVIVGESTSHNSATRQRFPHILVAVEKRSKNRKGWFRDHARFFFALEDISFGTVRNSCRSFSKRISSGARARSWRRRKSGRSKCMGLVTRPSSPWRGCSRVILRPSSTNFASDLFSTRSRRFKTCERKSMSTNSGNTY